MALLQPVDVIVHWNGTEHDFKFNIKPLDLMRRFALAALIGLALVAPAQARPHHSFGYGDAYYANVSGHRVHRPMAAGRKPAGATAHCGDGTWSFSEHHSGTCSHHGGVAEWL